MTRLLPPARYVRAGSVPAAEQWHTGLALPLYTHFTSPIRRYADQVVHRMLGASLGWPGYALEPQGGAQEGQAGQAGQAGGQQVQEGQAGGQGGHSLLLDHARLDALAHALNERKMAAKKAELDSLTLYTLSYFREQARPTRPTRRPTRPTRPTALSPGSPLSPGALRTPRAH